MLNIQKVAPDFTLPDQDEKNHTLSDYQGTFVLLYFYPKDDTPGCTREACAIRDVYKEFKKAGIQVIGVSKDSTKSHKKFEKKYTLPFILLSDEQQTVINAYEASRHPIGTRRISYLIDPKGIIVKAYPDVSPAEHPDEVLKDIKIFKKK